jgi:hypothetical protein
MPGERPGNLRAGSLRTAVTPLLVQLVWLRLAGNQLPSWVLAAAYMAHQRCASTAEVRTLRHVGPLVLTGCMFGSPCRECAPAILSLIVVLAVSFSENPQLHDQRVPKLVMTGLALALARTGSLHSLL